MSEHDNLWQILDKLEIDTESDDFKEKNVAGRTIGVSYNYDANVYHVFDDSEEYDVIVRKS